LLGDPKTRIYEWPECKGYPKNTKGYINFGNLSDAKALGYKASPRCEGSRLLSDLPDLPM